MAVTRAIFPKQYSNAIIRYEHKKNNCPMQYQAVINKNRQNKIMSGIVSIVSSTSKKLDQKKFTRLKIYFNVVCQVNIVKKIVLQSVYI